MALIADSVGADKFFWASDFPHSDHPENYMEELEELVQKMSPQAARGILGENVARAYKLELTIDSELLSAGRPLVMAYQEEKFHKLKYPGAIDADGHFVESPKLWLQYSEAKYKPRALQFKWNDKGVQYLEINGRPSKISRGATISGALFGRMEQTPRYEPLGSQCSIWRMPRSGAGRDGCARDGCNALIRRA